MSGAPAQRGPLVLVSNRGPVTFHAGGEVQRGSGGLVTALTGLASHRDAIWIASAMTEHDAEVSRANGGRAFPVVSPAGGEYQVRLVVSDPEAYDRFYNVFANPMLWFIQHYLWDLSNAPDIRREEIEAFEFGYNAVNEDLARAVVEEIEDVAEPVVMVHDYHLYTLPDLVRRARPDAFLHHFIHIPWTQSDAWRVLPTRISEEIYSGPLGQRHRRLPHPLLPAQLPAVLPRPDGPRGGLRARGRGVRGARGVGAGVSAADRPSRRRAGSPRARAYREFEAELMRRRRDHLILRVDRADLSQERAARLLGVRPVPGAASRVLRARHVRRPADAIADRRAGVRRVPRADRGAGGGRQPSPRHPRLDADPAEAARRPRRGDGGLQALRRTAGQRHVRRHEPGRQGGPDRQRARGRVDPLGEHRRARGARRVRAVGQPVRHPGDSPIRSTRR